MRTMNDGGDNYDDDDDWYIRSSTYLESFDEHVHLNFIAAI